MATNIITRAGKGSALNHGEMDQNLESHSLTTDLKIADYSLALSDQNKLIEMSGTNLTLNLLTVALAASAQTDSFSFWVKNLDATPCTVAPSGVETIDGAASLTLLENEAAFISLSADGTEWSILSDRNFLGVTATDTEINYNAGAIPGSAQPSRTLVLDASSDIATINSLTATDVIATTITFNGALIAASADEINYNAGVTPGTVTPSKTVTVDASSDVSGFNRVTSAEFVGPLTGNADTATSAITANTAVNFSGLLAGDVTGAQGATVVGDDSHSHTFATIVGLGALAAEDIVTPNLIDWANSDGLVQSLMSENFVVASGSMEIRDTTQIYINPAWTEITYYFRIISFNSNVSARLSATATGTTVSLPTSVGDGNWSTVAGTLDVSGDSGLTTINLQAQTTGGGNGTVIGDILWIVTG